MKHLKSRIYRKFKLLGDVLQLSFFLDLPEFVSTFIRDSTAYRSHYITLCLIFLSNRIRKLLLTFLIIIIIKAIKTKSEDKDLKTHILNLLRPSGVEFRSKKVLERAKKYKKRKLSQITILRKLEEYSKGEEPEVSKRIVGHKEVWYSLREDVLVEHLINDFMKELNDILTQLPVNMKRLDNEIIESAETRKKGREIVNEMKKKKGFNKMISRNLVLFNLGERVLKLLDDNLLEDEKGKICHEIVRIDCKSSFRKKRDDSILSHTIYRVL